MEPSSSFEDWITRYEAAYAAPESVADLDCPECGRWSLRLVFLVREVAAGEGRAVFWCDNCHTGLPTMLIDVPAGGTRVVKGEESIPEFRIVPPS